MQKSLATIRARWTLVLTRGECYFKVQIDARFEALLFMLESCRVQLFDMVQPFPGPEQSGLGSGIVGLFPFDSRH